MTKKQPNILQIIESRKGRFAPQHLKIARYLLSHPEKIAFLSSAQLARQVGVSQPTVIRFSQALGFARYQNFSEAFQDLIKAELTSADRFNLSLESDRNDTDGASNIILREIMTLTQLNRAFPWADFERAVARIVRSAEVHIVGTRGSAALAQYFCYFLGKVKRHVHLVADGATAQYDKLLGMDRESLVVAVAFPRYPRETVEFVSCCRERGLEVLAITDKIDSPLVPLADHSIVIPITFSTIFDSYCSALCLFNMIITSVGKRNKSESAKLFQEFEKMALAQNFFLTKARRADD